MRMLADVMVRFPGSGVGINVDDSIGEILEMVEELMTNLLGKSVGHGRPSFLNEWPD